ncbi:hypothetical protein [Bifidobacterium felsineum]|uniref:hypothetical protein n=1 Tax=Bifidobacterium felsineum TaxID=2045440 RepID=UPI001BDCA578|nr:hypothetical protein [Bifidobacterium felsineum]MBT1164645.1 hypothetical protein [Bifidobacterium felsineum]
MNGMLIRMKIPGHDHDMYVYKCDCGWQPEPQTTPDRAYREWLKHDFKAHQW